MKELYQCIKCKEKSIITSINNNIVNEFRGCNHKNKYLVPIKK